MSLLLEVITRTFSFPFCYFLFFPLHSIFFLLPYFRSWGSSVSIVSDYRLDGRGSIPGRGKAFTLCVQTSSEAHPASYPVDNKGPFPEVKCGRRVKLTTHPHLVPRSIMSRSYTASPSWSLHGVAGHLYFTLLSFNFPSFLSSTCPLFLSYINPSCCVTADSPDSIPGAIDWNYCLSVPGMCILFLTFLVWIPVDLQHLQNSHHLQYELMQNYKDCSYCSIIKNLADKYSCSNLLIRR
jgi:hypothetical protein